jgi:hypothetical protein
MKKCKLNKKNRRVAVMICGILDFYVHGKQAGLHQPKKGVF